MATSTFDLNVFESGSGGELAIISNDIHTSEKLYQTIYLALFGGNLEASTIGNEIASEERFDWWGNSLIFGTRQTKQFNSETERILDKVVLNSSGRLKIQSAVENDLSFIKNIVNFTVNIVILDINKIAINIVLESLANQQDKQLQFIWDNAKNELIINRVI